MTLGFIEPPTSPPTFFAALEKENILRISNDAVDVTTYVTKSVAEDVVEDVSSIFDGIKQQTNEGSINIFTKGFEQIKQLYGSKDTDNSSIDSSNMDNNK